MGIFFAGSASAPQEFYCVIMANRELGSYALHKSNKNPSGVYTDRDWAVRAFRQISARVPACDLCKLVVVADDDSGWDWMVITDEVRKR